MALHLVLVFSGYLLFRQTTSIWAWILSSLLIGHSLACLAFIAHDVSHNAVVRGKTSRWLLEILLWGLNLIPPTVWHRVHNQTHHLETNTVSDPDRAFLESEQTSVTRTYTRIFYPNRQASLQHPFVLVHFVAYIARNVIAALLPGGAKPSVVPYKPAFSLRQRIATVVEIGILGLLQYGIWLLVGADLWRFLCASLIPIFISSSVVMLYVFTNHFLNPLCEHSDPLVGSTSVIVPSWMDWLHDNFSYHTEHHVFPSVNPRYYPEVSRLLAEHFPQRYNRIHLREAWRRLWQQEEFIREDGVVAAKSNQGSAS